MNYFDNTPLKDTSVKQFNTKINEWVKFMPPFHTNIISIVFFPKMAMEALNTHMITNTNSNKHLYLMAVLSFLRHRPDVFTCITIQEREAVRQAWIDIHTANEAPIIQRRLENRPTDGQLKKTGVHMTFEELAVARDALPPGSIERLLIAMYTMIPPARADYFATQIVHDDQPTTEKNHVRLRGPARADSVLTDFKTAKQYKQITNQFPPELVAELQASLEKTPRTYLFLNANGKPHTRNSFTLWARRALTRILGKDFTLVFFRHAYVSHFIATNDMSTMTDAQVKELSDKMGHSPEMFRAYKWIKQGAKGDLTFEEEEEAGDASEAQ